MTGKSYSLYYVSTNYNIGGWSVSRPNMSDKDLINEKITNEV